MKWREYVLGVQRTEPTEDQYQQAAERMTRADPGLACALLRKLHKALDQFTARAGDLDTLKKVIFYNKAMIIPQLFSVWPMKESYSPKEMAFLHGVLGMLTEAGELGEALSKFLTGQATLAELRVNLNEELGDVMWYLAVTCEAVGLDLDMIQETNLNKLKKRYPERFNEAQAQNRDLEAETRGLKEDTFKLQTAEFSQLEALGRVDTPERYKHANELECIDEIRIALGVQGAIAFCEGQVMKYAYRSGAKPGDAEKEAWYRDMTAHLRGLGPDPRTSRPGWKPTIIVEDFAPVLREKYGLDAHEGSILGG